VAAHPGRSNTELARNSPAFPRLPLTRLAPLITQTASMGALSTPRNLVSRSPLGETSQDRLDVDDRRTVERLEVGDAHPQALDGKHGDAVQPDRVGTVG
jgi:hypothetical protein